MTPEQQQAIQTHVEAISAILYADCEPESLKTLEDIELAVKERVLTHVTPQILRNFFIYSASGTKAGRVKKLKSTLGDLSITEKQAELLGCGTGSRLSPHLENCCLRLSANVAYESASKDIKYITGVTVPSKTQLILVHDQEFNKPVATLDITELSVDGGKARLITPPGEKSEWKDYKAIVSEAGIVASFDKNNMIIDWANQQPLANPVTCLGDGHDGVWNIFKEISCEQNRREILDGYHLNENLHLCGWFN